MSPERDRPGWWMRLKALLIWLLARLLAATLRMRVRGLEQLRRLRERGPVIYAFWHGRQLALFRANPDRQLATITSHSRDGQLQALICRKFGLRVVRGSSSRGGLAGLLALHRVIKQGWSVAVAVDGPRGPVGEAKPGVAALCRATGAPLVPVAASASRKLVLRRSWDAFQIPAPLARTEVWFGDPLYPDCQDLPEALDRRLKQMCQELDEQTASAGKKPEVASTGLKCL